MRVFREKAYRKSVLGRNIGVFRHHPETQLFPIKVINVEVAHAVRLVLRLFNTLAPRDFNSWYRASTSVTKTLTPPCPG
jgi:hypothetical protein